MSATLTIHNRYDFLNLKDNVTFHWALSSQRDTIARGAFSPACAPHDSVAYTLNLPLVPAGKLALLHFDVVDAQGHRFLQQSFVISKPRYEWSSQGDVAALIQHGPLVRAGRKATLAERVTQKERLPQRLPVARR
jgi:hypothetical protein